MTNFLGFKLPDDFVEEYANKEVPWGFKSGPGVTLGEVTFLRTYSGLKADGKKEKWYEVAKRVVEGTYSIQKDYMQSMNMPWSEGKAERSAAEMYDRLHGFKWWPSGRGLEHMGTKSVNEWGFSDTLYSCVVVDTLNIKDPARPFWHLMYKLMRGTGVGYTSDAHFLTKIEQPKGSYHYPIPDTTEGWCDSTYKLIKSYFDGSRKPHFGYDLIRKEGEPISTGGVAPGPEPLRELHEKLDKVLSNAVGSYLDVVLINDIGNLCGQAVAAGGKRRGALLYGGFMGMKNFMDLKDWNLEKNDERMGDGGWGSMSNNSIRLGSDRPPDFEWYVDRQLTNGEPGMLVMDLMRNYGRMTDGYKEGCDANVVLVNPCGEATLEDLEVCNLVTINMMNHDSLEDFLRSIKFGYLYAKTITLMPTSIPETNVVQFRNRRIGCSVSGVAAFVAEKGYMELIRWLDSGYNEINKWDDIYSRWFGIRESIKKTVVKPEGSASILSGSTPGVHFPVFNTFIRHIRFQRTDPLVKVLQDAGYKVEPDKKIPKSTVVIGFPVKLEANVRHEQEVPVREKVDLAVLAQRYWADQSVSSTITFHPHEKDALATAFKDYWGQFKSMSTMTMFNQDEIDEKTKTYAQLPFQAITEEKYEELVAGLGEVDLDAVYERKDNEEATGDNYCSSDKCEI